MKPNISENEALDIARKYCEKNIKSLQLEDNIKKIEFHENYPYNSRHKEPAWTIDVKIDLKGFEGIDIVRIVISDKLKKFVFLIDHNGIPQTDCY